ncbi:MAG: ECF transporter S component [Bacillota bacterium]
MRDTNLLSTLQDFNYKEDPARIIAYQALMIAFVSLATFLYFPGPSSSYFNLGEVAIYMIALSFGGKVGGIAGAFGSAITDVLLGYSIWAPFTFVIKGLEGYVVGRIAGGKRDIKTSIIAIILGGHIMIVGYAITKGILISPAAVLPEIFIDYGQMIIGGIAAIPLSRRIISYFRNK